MNPWRPMFWFGWTLLFLAITGGAVDLLRHELEATLISTKMSATFALGLALINYARAEERRKNVDASSGGSA